jgi:hypothetical protein
MSTNRHRANAKPVLGEPLLHPIAFASICVLLLNDHWLKPHFPGIVTGKLSDVAGLVFFPLLLLTLYDALRRITVGRSGLGHRALVTCIALTGLVFILAKTTHLGAEAYRITWAALKWPMLAVKARRLVSLGRVQLVEDPTDLIALPMLLVAYWIGKDATTNATRA